jgi:hypothetical protein
MVNHSTETFCCLNCFNDEEIQDCISSADQTGDCDYCRSREINVAQVDEVAEFIKAGIERVYEDAAEHIPHDSGEGGYQFPTKTITDILTDEWAGIFGEGLGDPAQLIDDFGIDDGTPYVRQDPFGPASGEHVQR